MSSFHIRAPHGWTLGRVAPFMPAVCEIIVWTTVVRLIILADMATGRPFDSLEQEVFLSLWRTYDRLRALEDELFGRYDLTPQQYNALRLLAGRHPETIRTLDGAFFTMPESTGLAASAAIFASRVFSGSGQISPIT